jgi:hypothetical protein
MIVYNKADLAQECFREVRSTLFRFLDLSRVLTAFLYSLCNEL